MARNVLVADIPQLAERFARVLADDRLTHVHTLAEALKALSREDFDLVLIGMHFDDSRMFDLLREVRAGQRNREVRVLCYRGRQLAFSALGVEALEVSVNAMRGDGFLDLTAFADEAQANQALHRLVNALFTARG